MTDYAIGDIQGCHDQLMRLLDKIQFNEHQDRLWCVGDLVNRGAQSLEVLRFLSRLKPSPMITLGNHDFHLLSLLFTNNRHHFPIEHLAPVVYAHDADELGYWLLQQPLMHVNDDLTFVMTHAGIAPIWTLEKAKMLADEFYQMMQTEEAFEFLYKMYGNLPSKWDDTLKGMDRWRCIVNYFTRMRLCYEDGSLDFAYKGTLKDLPAQLTPWFLMPKREPIPYDIVFGHWAALKGKSGVPHIHAIDTGCIWGGGLTALRLTDKNREVFLSR
jgi:bis(5'-nucleosyl)-tetraphosphatase (symmetrical)